MAKMIEVVEMDGTRQLINLGHVVRVFGCGNRTWIEFDCDLVDDDGETCNAISVMADYKSVRRLIGSAQGGIPMEREADKISCLD